MSRGGEREGGRGGGGGCQAMVGRPAAVRRSVATLFYSPQQQLVSGPGWEAANKEEEEILRGGGEGRKCQDTSAAKPPLPFFLSFLSLFYFSSPVT